MRTTFRWAAAGALLFVAIVAIVLVMIRRAPETYPWSDTAATSIYAMRAARGELSTGAYSRFQWNHPGPLLYQLLAPLYRLSGYREVSLKWTMLGINLSVLLATLTVAWRRSHTLAITLAIALLPIIYFEQRLLFWAWNPIAPLLALALYLVLAAAVASGTVALLPILAAVASFVVQTHVGFVPVVAAATATAIAIAATGTLRCTDTKPLRQTMLTTAGVVLALWAVPLVHEIRTWPGNLAALVGFFVNEQGVGYSWTSAVNIAAVQLVGPFTPGWEVATAGAAYEASWTVLLSAAAQCPLLLVSAAMFRRRGEMFASALSLIALSGTVTGPYAIRHITGPVSDYLVVWLAIVGAVNLAVIAANAFNVLHVATIFQRSVWRYALAAYVIGVADLGVRRLEWKQASDARSDNVLTLSRHLEKYCVEHDIDRPLFGFSEPAWQTGVGIVLQFYKAQRRLAVSDDYLYIVGEPFRATHHEQAEFYLMSQDEYDLPPGAIRHEWLAAFGSFRLIRVFRN